jgi:pimeloyl-ACP methyl ester carboxylesterase
MRGLAGETHGAGGGIPLILIHAFPFDGRMWDSQRGTLSAGRRLLVPDLRGFGRSPLPKSPHSIDEHARDVAEFLATNSVERTVLCGLSMGGYVALAFAALFPERLAGLVLADTRAGADTPAAKATGSSSKTCCRNSSPRTPSGTTPISSAEPAP